jgi:hypothetical protein
VEAYLQMKARAEPGFPSTNAIRNNLGSRLERLAKVKAFCEARSGYEDVIHICDKELALATASAEPEVADAPDDDAFGFGCIYLMKSGR